MALIYTNIQHEFRKKHSLSCNEYVVCDMIHFLSTSNKTSVAGWCYMSRENMADEVGLTKKTIINIIDKMIDEGFLEKDDIRKYLKTTEKWQATYYTTGVKFTPGEPEIGVNNTPHAGVKSTPYNNTLDNNNNNDKNNNSLAEKLKIKKDKFYKDLMQYKKLNSGKFPSGLYEEFFKYWTEESRDQKKIRMESEQFFNIGKRMGTFKKNAKLEDLNKWELQDREAQQKNTLFQN